MTIDEAIVKLEKVKNKSKYKGNTEIYLCLVGSGVEYTEIDNILIEESDYGNEAIARIDADIGPVDPALGESK